MDMRSYSGNCYPLVSFPETSNSTRGSQDETCRAISRASEMSILEFLFSWPKRTFRFAADAVQVPNILISISLYVSLEVIDTHSKDRRH